VSGPLVGLLLLDKPVGLSSNAALQRVRHLAGGIKAGHGGSLDPLASGMLPICLGEATRLAGELLEGRKAYHFGVQLGERSDTGDAEGAIIERRAVPALTESQVRVALDGMLGVQQQVPPMYSALKRDGVPLYRLARAGQEVERAARTITIDEFTLLALAPERLELRVLCSKGTYIRVLAQDLAHALGTCGRLYSLRREYVEPFAGEPMVCLEQLAGGAAALSQWPVLGADRAVAHLPRLQLDAAAARSLAQGRALALATAAGGKWRLYDETGRFLGLGRSDSEGELRVQRLFSQPLAV
jgi:tRNA pseudouridine55 synthase